MNFYTGSLFCEVCDFKMLIPRKKGQKRELGHIKHMYCPRCKETTGFIEETRDESVDFWEEWHDQNQIKEK